MAKAPKLKSNGEPDMRGHGEGSKATRLGHNDGRRRPGRPKGARDERTLVHMIKNMKVKVSVPGLPPSVDTQLGYLLRLRERALKGDLRAIEMLDRKLSQYAPPIAQPDLTQDLLEEDADILSNARQRGVLPPPNVALAGSTAVPPTDPTNDIDQGDDQ